MQERTMEMPVVKTVRRAGWVGLLCNLLLAAAKAAAGVFGHSQAVLADALHSLTDSVTDVAVILGVRYWTAPADEDHPHGHGRIETLVTVIIGFSIGLVAVGMGWQAIRGLRHGEDVRPPAGIALGVALLSIGVKEALYRWTAGVGRTVNSPALVANAWHHRSDAISSIPAALAVAVALLVPGWAFVDRVGAIVVCIFILYAAWRILHPALNQLIDAGAPPEERRRIEELALEVDGVEAAHALRTRYVGAKLAVELHLEVDGGLSVGEGHAIAQAVRRRLLA
ncbi:MAG: cation transporter, partial [Acidobacteria bacterium]|nr:cation transporter [Acidobacteriota bacterium]